MIVKGNLADTDYEQFKNQFEEFERAKLEKERKQREFQKKSNDYDFEDFEDDFIDIGGSSESNSSFFNPSVIAMIGFAGILFYVLIIKNKKNEQLKDD